MKKFFIIIILILIVIIGVAYFILFTQPGNNILKPFVKSKIEAKLKLPVIIDDFSLRTSFIKLYFTSPDALKVKLDSKFTIFGKDVDGWVNVDILDFSKFKEFTQRPLNGKCNIKIDFKGNLNNKLNVNIISNIFNGNIDAKISLNNNKLENLFYNAKNIKIENMLYFLDEKQYAQGFIDSFGKFNFESGKGNAKTLFTGDLSAKLIRKEFNIALPNTHFKGEILNTLTGRNISTIANIYSTLANLFLDKTYFNIDDKSLKSHYVLKVNNLSVFNKMTNQKLIGRASVDGILNFKNNIYTKGIATLNKNKFSYEMTFPELTVVSKKFASIDILKTVSMPPIFKTYANVNLKYNIKTKKGKLKINFDEGFLMNTKLFKTIKSLTGIDLTLEVYKNGFLTTDINDKILKNIFELKSKNTIISSKKTILNLLKSTIDSEIDFQILGMPIKIFLTGNMKQPDIKTDFSKILKSKVKKNVEKILENKGIEPRKFKKDIKKNVKDIKKNIKNLFQNFR